MDAETLASNTPEPKPEASAQVSNESLLEDAGLLWQEILELAYDHLQLAGLETKRAAESLVDMFAAGVLAGMLLGTAWLGFAAAFVLELVGDGLSAKVAILLVIAINLILALVLVGVIRWKIRSLLFPATLRSLATRSPKRQENGET